MLADSQAWQDLMKRIQHLGELEDKVASLNAHNKHLLDRLDELHKKEARHYGTVIIITGRLYVSEKFQTVVVKSAEHEYTLDTDAKALLEKGMAIGDLVRVVGEPQMTTHWSEDDYVEIVIVPYHIRTIDTAEKLETNLDDSKTDRT